MVISNTCSGIVLEESELVLRALSLQWVLVIWASTILVLSGNLKYCEISQAIKLDFITVLQKNISFLLSCLVESKEICQQDLSFKLIYVVIKK
jgi:hypothetical protein